MVREARPRWRHGSTQNVDDPARVRLDQNRHFVHVDVAILVIGNTTKLDILREAGLDGFVAWP